VADDLCFLGERQDAIRLMQALDFLVLPSHHEGLSNALLEAMVAGCPVVASAVGGTPELVEREHTGLLFPTDDAGALADCLDLLASDSGLRAGLASRALARAQERYAVPAMVAATTAVYDRCLANRVAPRHGSAAAAQPTPYRGHSA
jgi:glycosyltransferase involved in cell wall biosynthesis